MTLTRQFQSTFPQGERQYNVALWTGAQGFQSTFPQGERPHLLPPVSLRQIRFNPRSRKGNDGKFATSDNSSYVSIHVPARGTTHCAHPFLRSDKCFNPRSRKGNDDGDADRAAHRRCFNPRSRKGNDIRTGILTTSISSFNPRSRKGNDRTRFDCRV